MRRTFQRICALVIGFIIVASVPMTAHAEEGYTYNYDYWGEIQYSPDAYTVESVYTSSDFGLDVKMKSPSGMFVHGNMIYICDSGNNRILEIEKNDKGDLSLKREIDSFSGNVKNKSFSEPTDISVSDDGHMYICDKNNGRIVKLDKNLNLELEFTIPVDPNFDATSNFLPSKLAVDSAGRVYCIATNVNKGLIKYEADGTFAGFTGASKVSFNWTDYMWKKFATKEQRSQMESFVPTEYDNLYMDGDGFIYVCTQNLKPGDIKSGASDPIRRLNLMGNDILIRNGNQPIIGDKFGVRAEMGKLYGPSKMVDITALDNEIYVALDRLRGRLFAYDDQGRLLFAFGGKGNMDGYFNNAIALDHIGNDLLVLDAQDCSITVFTPTEYGQLIYSAIDQFQKGEYQKSGETWNEVLKYNGNCDRAYIGIGRALLSEGKYEEAMEYFELKYDDENYSRAYKQYRKEWVEDHIVLIVTIIVLVLCVPLAIGHLKKVKKEIDTAVKAHEI